MTPNATAADACWYRLGMTRWRIALAAAVLYAVMWVGYLQNWVWLHGLDWSLLNASHDIAVKHPAWVQFWSGFTYVFGPEPLRLLGLVAAAVLLVRRNVRAALLVVTCAPLNGLVTTGAKALANRPRPPTMLEYAPSTSFPSGHALEATAAWLALLTLLLPVLSASLRRVAIAVAAVVLVLVGISRVALNVHYPSDVLAGWALGYLYFLLCLLVFRPRAPLVTAQ